MKHFNLPLSLACVAICTLLSVSGFAQKQSELRVLLFNGKTLERVMPTKMTLTNRLTNEVLADESTATFRQGKSFARTLEKGKYTIDASLQGYHDMKTNIELGSDETQTVRLFLSPKTDNNAYVRTLLKPNKTVLLGYVTDFYGEPLQDATVHLSDGSALTQTNEQGYFELFAPANSDPTFKTLVFEKEGFIKEEHTDVTIMGNLDFQYAITMTKGEGTKNVSQLKRTGQQDDAIVDEHDHDHEERNHRTLQQAVPTSIRVGLANSTGTQCCTGGCYYVDYVDINLYVKRTLPSEWLPAWSGLPNIGEAYKAGAIAIRSYASWHVYNPARSNYDICSSACCQAYGQATSSVTDPHVDATSGEVLRLANGTIARAEYSAENNNLSGYSCVVGNVNANGCGDGKFGLSGVGSPCYDDPLGSGFIQFGHGRGMSQFGSVRWASGRKIGTWCQGSFSNGPTHAYGQHSYVQILQRYYPTYVVPNSVPTPTNLRITDQGSHIDFNWDGAGVEDGLWWVDVSTHGDGTSGDWSNSNFHHKPLASGNGTHQTNSYALYENWYYNSVANGGASMTLQQGTRYYWRLFNGTTHFEGPSFVFGASNSGVNLVANGVSDLMWPFYYSKDEMLTVCGSNAHVGEDYWADDWSRSGGNSCGTYMYAPMDGEIIHMGFQSGGYGNQIIIQNGGFAVRMAHLQEFASGLQVGDFVTANTYLGRMGTTGNSTGCHLHIALYEELGTTEINRLRNGWSASGGNSTIAARVRAKFNLSVPNQWQEGRGSACIGGPDGTGTGRHQDMHHHQFFDPDQASILENSLSIFPNPVLNTAKVQYILVADAEVSVRVLDVTGKERLVLLNHQALRTGTHELTLNKEGFESGIYIVQVITGDMILSKKVVFE